MDIHNCGMLLYLEGCVMKMCINVDFMNVLGWLHWYNKGVESIYTCICLLWRTLRLHKTHYILLCCTKLCQVWLKAITHTCYRQQGIKCTQSHSQIMDDGCSLGGGGGIHDHIKTFYYHIMYIVEYSYTSVIQSKTRSHEELDMERPKFCKG